MESRYQYCNDCYKAFKKRETSCSYPKCVRKQHDPNNEGQDPQVKKKTDKKFPCNHCKCTLDNESAKFHMCPGKPIGEKNEEPMDDRRSDRREFKEDDRRYRKQSYDNRGSRRDEEERNQTRPSDERKYFNQPEDRRYREQKYDNRGSQRYEEERNRTRPSDDRKYYNQPETNNNRAYGYTIQTEYIFRRRSKDR